MNSKYSRTNLGLFTLERCDDYNSKFASRAWRVQHHKIFRWRPCDGPFMFTRFSAVLAWVANVWEDLFPQPTPLSPEQQRLMARVAEVLTRPSPWLSVIKGGKFPKDVSCEKRDVK